MSGSSPTSDRSPESYEAEIARLEKALSDECANSLRIVDEKANAIKPLWEALETIRLYGSPWWKPEWDDPSKIASEAMNKAARYA